MRSSVTLVAILLSSAALVSAQEPCPKEFDCTGLDRPVINATTGHTVGAPAEKKPGPRVKISGSLMANSMMSTEFDAAASTFTRERLYLITSRAWTERATTGWGASLQWSPDDYVWVEASYQRPPVVTIGIDSSVTFGIVRIPCREGQPCETRIGADGANRHVFDAHDVALAVKWDAAPKDSRYVSVLLGVGVHRRYLRAQGSITNAQVSPFAPPQTTVIETDQKTTQTRGFVQLDAEIYPAGKRSFVGLVLSGRLLGDGNREQQHFTGTLVQEKIMMGIYPGFYDVTARLVLRF